MPSLLLPATTARRSPLCLAALALLAGLGGAQPLRAEPDRPVRAVWVTRWDYRSAEDVRRIFARCAELGANRVLFQVRGAAATCYPSRLEPWDPALGGGDPGWDPLAVAVEAARAHGLALEAWINLLPLWRGAAGPTDPAHPYLRHPEWVVVGSDGQPQRRSAHYVCANPCLPEVREHLAAVAAELAAAYPVDAIHLDYVRWVLDLETDLDFSWDAATLARFGGDPKADAQGWARFKAGAITELVGAVRAGVRAARAGCRLTAAVFPTRESRAKVGQDVEAWVAAGLVDALYPMTYADDPAEFARRLAESLPLGAGRVPVIPGVAVFRQADPAATLEQLSRVTEAGAAGAALFCYAALCDSADREELHQPDEELRRRRREAVQGAWDAAARR